MPTWTWYGEPTWRYKDEKGLFASQRDLWAFSEASIDSTSDKATEAALSLGVQDFEAFMRRTIKMEVCRQYVLGLGGQGELTKSDYGAMGGIIADQYRYLDQFIARIEEGRYTPAQIAMYAKMYIQSTREAFERASSKTRGMPQMPAYPGDGNSCLGLTNCKCHWEYHYRNGRWECYWVMSAVENCELCIGHSLEWAPYIVEVNQRPRGLAVEAGEETISG